MSGSAHRPRVLYLLPASSLHGGIRVVLEQADGLQRRGYEVHIVGPEPPPDWHPLTVPYHQLPLDQPGSFPEAEIVIGTFWTTVPQAYATGAPYVFHLCQGFEGIHREYAPMLSEIDSAYRLPIPKLLISSHLEPILNERYGCRCYVIGLAVDSTLFTPGPFRREARPLRVGVVGPFWARPKGIPELLRGLALARAAGFELEVHRASADPLSEEERDLRVTDRYFHRLSTVEMVEFYRGLDAYLHPSHDEEGFGLPALEAMACGVPVALTRIRPFAVLPDDAVIRFPPGEPEAVVPVVAQLMDPDRRWAMRTAGIACARTFTLDRVLDRLEEAFAAEGATVVRQPHVL